MLEQLGDLERKRQTRVIAPGLYRVDRLARYVQAVCEISLAPTPLGAKLSQAVVHRDRDLMAKAATQTTTPPM